VGYRWENSEGHQCQVYANGHNKHELRPRQNSTQNRNLHIAVVIIWRGNFSLMNREHELKTSPFRSESRHR
jgi:hypothetical protein